MLKIVTSRTLLIVESEENLSKTLALYFKKQGNTVYTAESIVKAKKLLSLYKFDGVILEPLLTDGDGLELFNAYLPPPTVIFSSISSEEKMLEAFSVGAVDYVVKPCSFALLETRLALRLSPKKATESTLYEVYINSITREVRYKNEKIGITSSEFNILWLLMQNPGVFFNADAIYENIWEVPSLKQASIRYHISNLRKKLFTYTGKNLIITAFGKGYAFPKEE